MSEAKNPKLQRFIGPWVEAVIFDLDGVITDTARAHFQAWKQMFDAYLETLERRQKDRGDQGHQEYQMRGFDHDDYLQYVDGKPRYDGVRSFLRSRGIELDTGSSDDPPGRETICGLGNRKNMFYQEFLADGEVEVFPSTLELIRKLKAWKIKTAVVSASKNCKKVLAAANIEELFDTHVDGMVAESLGLPGKPAPDIFLKAAEELNVRPKRAIVVEDAIAGVEAGRRGGFGYIVGVDRKGRGRELLDHGADIVVGDLSEIRCEISPRRRGTTGLRSALNRIEEIIESGEQDGWNKKILLFLDYDGTLTPIAERPENAVLSTEMMETIRSAGEHFIVGIVSGRDLKDLQERIPLENIHYAGSHGFDIEGPARSSVRNETGTEALPLLDEAEIFLQTRLDGLSGIQVERKRFSISVHHRRAAPDQAEAAEKIVDDILNRLPGLRRGTGKKVIELQPDVPWNKGRAILWIMERLGHDPETARPIYIGDDITDEDAFRAVYGCGAGIVVHGGEDRSTYAGYGLSDPSEVRLFIERLLAAMTGDR